MIKKFFVCISFLTILLAGTAQAEDKKAQTTKILDEAVKHYQSVGAENAFKDFSVKEGDYFKGEIYVIVMKKEKGKIVFHAVNPKLVGKSLEKIKDTDGKLFVQEMLDVSGKDGSGWVSYKWPHPQTKKITQKHSYFVAVEDQVFIAGYYE
ncbi:MAG: cache domain-containing protein [Sneathiellales bacterium]|nr:cache domain-containing protein [Sneathiellales bacterium]